MPCFGCTPEHLPELLAGVLRGSDPRALATEFGADHKTWGGPTLSSSLLGLGEMGLMAPRRKARRD